MNEVIDPPWTLPNLVPDVENVSIKPLKWDPESFTFVSGPPQLFFDTLAQNLGSVALELTADDPRNLATSPVSQCVVWVTEHVCRERTTVGGFAWHDSHGHYHFEGFASYSLRKVRRDGSPNYSKRGLVSMSDKVSFCLMDTGQVEFSFPGFLLRYYTLCTPAIQGISAGWMDVYGDTLEGQQLPLNGASDGRYALIIDMDNDGRLHEADDTDNVVVATIEISNGGTEVAIVGKQYPMAGADAKRKSS
ncbi:MAG: hypothetical protein KY443_02470 [Actinobacteria bacterium]|nr:hypothetical protein [Actinomycetota bacterium]